jgi:hypothetical protein
MGSEHKTAYPLRSVQYWLVNSPRKLAPKFKVSPGREAPIILISHVYPINRRRFIK